LVEWPSGEHDFVQVFARDVAELKALREIAAGAVVEDRLLWVCYPKKSSAIATDISRNVCRETLEPLGLRPVPQVAPDDTWSAWRFRPADRVGK